MRKHVIRNLWNRLARYRILVVISMIMAAVTVAGTLYMPVLMGDAIDCIIAKGKVDFAAMLPILGKGGITVIITALSQWIMNVCNNRVTYHMTGDIRNDDPNFVHVSGQKDPLPGFLGFFTPDVHKEVPHGVFPDLLRVGSHLFTDKIPNCFLPSGNAGQTAQGFQRFFHSSAPPRINSLKSRAAASASHRRTVSTGLCMYLIGTETMAVATPCRLTCMGQPFVPLLPGSTSME